MAAAATTCSHLLLLSRQQQQAASLRCRLSVLGQSRRPAGRVTAQQAPAANVRCMAAVDTASAAATETTSDEATSALEDRLAKLRKGGRKTVKYKAATLEEERAYAAWVRDALVAATARKEPPKQAPDGFSLRVMGDVWLLEEKKGKKRGAGVIVVRTGRARPILVEAPHTFFDKGTLPIALAVFEAQGARALLINTVHRYIDKQKDNDAGAKDEKENENDDEKEKDDEKGAEDDDKQPDRDEIDDPDAGIEIVPSDVAHAEQTFFLAAHRELLALMKDVTVVQLHGFRDEKVPDVGVIVSASKTSGDAEGLAARLGPALPDTQVKSYPKDVQTLGGTTNVEARACREMSAPFFHVEIARTWRDKLTSDKALRAKFAAALDPILPVKPPQP